MNDSHIMADFLMVKGWTFPPVFSLVLPCLVHNYCTPKDGCLDSDRIMQKKEIMGQIGHKLPPTREKIFGQYRVEDLIPGIK